MLMQLISFMAIVAFSLVPDDPAGKEPAADLKSVTVVVVDRDGEAPIKSFTCRAWYDVPGRKRAPDGNLWTPVISPAGTFELQVPSSCRLSVLVKAPDYIGGYPLLNEFVIKSTDNPRKVVVRLRKGITVKGSVRDSQTGEPISGATVAPLISVLPVWEPDKDKQVKTGVDGRYEVRGVDPELGVSASHPDYPNFPDFPDGKRTGPNHDIFLAQGVTVAARVVDSDGNPLEGAKSIDINGKEVASDKNGKLIFRNPDPFLALTFHKEGYIDRKIEFEKISREMSKPGGFVVVMETTIELKGRVVAPDGRPVSAFSVAAGPSDPTNDFGPPAPADLEVITVPDGPSKVPSRWNSVQCDVKGGEGSFSLGLSKEGKTWVGVAAEGFAAWEGWVEVKRGGEPMEVRLSPGVVVSARVAVPESLKGRVKARLIPRRDKSDIGGLPSEPPAEELPTRTASLSSEGILKFEHVRPDGYRLILEAPGLRETVLAIDVPRIDLDLGLIPINVPAATGRIEGQVWRPQSDKGGVWAFAEGYLKPFPYRGSSDEVDQIDFQADEDGRFKIDRVPVGLTTIRFPFQVFDVIDSYEWTALVVEGQTTVIRAFDPEGHREYTLAFDIGDGSKSQYESGTGLGASRKVENVTSSSPLIPELDGKAATPREPMFRVELTPLSKGPLLYAEPDWEVLDSRRKVVLPDVGPGTYRLRIHDWLGLRGLESGPLFDQEVDVPHGGRGEVHIALGSGCITGKIPAPKQDFDRPVEVTALAKGGDMPLRRARCDDDGHFCVRYLSPGTYTLFIHDPKAGYCRVDDVVVPAGVVDVGERKLSAGASVRGDIRFERLSPLPDEVVAVGPSGVTVRREFQVYSSFDRFEFAGLWPGQWIILVRKGNSVLTSEKIKIGGTEKSYMSLTTGR